ncbi:1-phosphofructokinase family hexose kinase [Paenibacillus sp. y28]|uniref:1-phosphofructokinase family hexose kinase n=1 Tax=Paenibacillus sp. y28 TaxID=3129110 RepID=UPI0030194768
MKRTLITTVTLNAALDKTYVLPRFALHTANRVGRMLVYPGGKGVNMARVVHQLGGDVLAAGFAAGWNGERLAAELDARGVKHRFVPACGESRLALTIIDEEAEREASSGAGLARAVTELIEPGHRVTPQQLEALLETVQELARQSYIVALCGSLPEGAPADTYAALVEAARAEGALVFVDSSGAALAASLGARPDLIKPNAPEAAGLLGAPVPSDEASAVALLRQLIGADDRGGLPAAGPQTSCPDPSASLSAGITATSDTARNAPKAGADGALSGGEDKPCLRPALPYAVLTLGADGALAASREDGLLRVRVPAVPARSAVGCGDAFFAGLALGFARGLPFPEALRLAAATGTAVSLQLEAGAADPADVQRLLKLVAVERLEG